jgi:hypothetical protein
MFRPSLFHNPGVYLYKTVAQYFLHIQYAAELSQFRQYVIYRNGLTH